MIERMRDEELETVSDILCECYRWLAETEGYSELQLADMIECRGTVEALKKQAGKYECYVYRRNGEVVGLVAINGNELAKLYVKTTHHKQGIGKELFQYAEEIIKKEYADMYLGAFKNAIPFYEKMGMKIREWKLIDSGPLEGKRQSIIGKEWT